MLDLVQESLTSETMNMYEVLRVAILSLGCSVSDEVFRYLLWDNKNLVHVSNYKVAAKGEVFL